MKIKTFFICFLAVCAISLSSCKKENYAAKFVGNYVTTLTPNLQVLMFGEVVAETTDEDVIEGVTFNISQVGESQDVNMTFTIPEIEESAELPIEIPNAVILNGTCDETGLHLSGYPLSESISIPELGMDIAINVGLGSATIAEPVNNVISWTSSLIGTIGITMPDMPEANMEATIDGGIKFNATKQ